MATQAAVPPSTALCDYCNQKPKFAGHSFCSKTCAAQAAALCDYCHKKPKFQGFNYCGKNCAGQANTRTFAAGAGTSQPANNIGTGATYAKGRNNTAASQPQRQQQLPAATAAPAIDPVQLAKLVAQHIPQVAQTFFNPSQGPSGASGGNPSSFMGGPTPQVMPSRINTNPFIGGVPATQQNLDNNGGIILSDTRSNTSAQPRLPRSTGNNQQDADNLRCLIPGCGKPVHVDAKGVKTSDYCSLRHREEAVTSGLRSPCILCLAYPQSDTDYFCSRACREESMNKYMEYDYYDDEETVVSDREVAEV